MLRFRPKRRLCQSLGTSDMPRFQKYTCCLWVPPAHLSHVTRTIGRGSFEWKLPSEKGIYSSCLSYFLCVLASFVCWRATRIVSGFKEYLSGIATTLRLRSFFIILILLSASCPPKMISLVSVVSIPESYAIQCRSPS